MTDFTATIEGAAASAEDLQEDLEAHLEDILGIDVTVHDPEVCTDEYGSYFSANIVFDDLEDVLETRFDADEVSARSLGLRIEPTVSDGDPE